MAVYGSRAAQRSKEAKSPLALAERALEDHMIIHRFFAT